MWKISTWKWWTTYTPCIQIIGHCNITWSFRRAKHTTFGTNRIWQSTRTNDEFNFRYKTGSQSILHWICWSVYTISMLMVLRIATKCAICFGKLKTFDFASFLSIEKIIMLRAIPEGNRVRNFTRRCLPTKTAKRLKSVWKQYIDSQRFSQTLPNMGEPFVVLNNKMKHIYSYDSRRFDDSLGIHSFFSKNILEVRRTTIII